MKAEHIMTIEKIGISEVTMHIQSTTSYTNDLVATLAFSTSYLVSMQPVPLCLTVHFYELICKLFPIILHINA